MIIGLNENVTATSYSGYIGRIVGFINSLLVPLVIGLAVLYYLWNVVRYISNSSNESERTKATKGMFYGIIALFVMTSVWGLVNVATDLFGAEGFGIPQLDSDDF